MKTSNVSIFFGRKSRWLEEVIRKELTSWLTQTLLMLKLQLHNHVLLETAKLYQLLIIFKSEYVFHMHFLCISYVFLMYSYVFHMYFLYRIFHIVFFIPYFSYRISHTVFLLPYFSYRIFHTVFYIP